MVAYGNNVELIHLVTALCDGEIVPAELTKLDRLLLDDVTARRFYYDYVTLHGELAYGSAAERAVSIPLQPFRVAGGRAEGDAPAVPWHRFALPRPPSVLGFLGNGVRWTHDYFSQPEPLSILAATIFMVCLISILSILPAPTYEHIRSNHACTTSTSSTGFQPVNKGKKLNFVARITGLHNCRWSPDGRAPLGYDHMAVGRELKLDSGMVKITYKTGANIILEGPVEFTVEEENACRLDLGKLTAKVSKQAVGFAVETPTTTIVDLGTEFGVEADRQGKTEVAVFLGAVEVGSESGGGGFRLTAGQAARVDAKGALTVLESGGPRDSRPRFVRHMPGTPAVQTGIDAEHIGANDPETQDPVAWTAGGAAAAKRTTGAGNDELAHWRIKNNEADKGYSYRFALTRDKLFSPAGWTATAVAKLVTANSAYNACFGVSDGSNWWMFTLIGGPGVSGPGVYTAGPNFADLVLLSPVDPTLAYHTYQIVYDPDAYGGDGGVTLYMDGRALITCDRVDATDSLTKGISFGDGTAGNRGVSESQWASCRFQTGQCPITEKEDKSK